MTLAIHIVFVHNSMRNLLSVISWLLKENGNIPLAHTALLVHSVLDNL